MSIFKGTPANPYHVSIGAIITDAAGNYVMLKNGSKYSFMCGTIENDEAPEQTLRREMFEEMGAHGHLQSYLGASLIDATVEMGADFPFQKCILWFQCALSGQFNEDITDPSGEVVRVKPADLPLLDKDNGRWPHGLTL